MCRVWTQPCWIHSSLCRIVFIRALELWPMGLYEDWQDTIYEPSSHAVTESGITVTRTLFIGATLWQRKIVFLCRERETLPLPRLKSVILLLSWTRSSVFQMPQKPTKTYAADSKVLGTSSSLSMLSVLFHKEYSICTAHWTGKATVSQ